MGIDVSVIGNCNQFVSEGIYSFQEKDFGVK